jgi:hypothetical protein
MDWSLLNQVYCSEAMNLDFNRKMKTKEKQKRCKEKILLAILPYWDPMIPPMGIASLKRFLRGYGYNVRLIDLIVKSEFPDFYSKYFEVLKRCIPENKWGNFKNIGHDVLQNHMMAHINYQDEGEYIELVKLLIYKSYYVEVDSNGVRELVEIMHRFYAVLETDFLKLLEEEKPDVLGLTAYKGTLPASLFILKLTRKIYPHIKTVLGGGAFADSHALGSPNFEALSEKTKDYLDKIIVGQGELLFLEYLQGELPGSQRVYTKADINGRILDFRSVETPDFQDLDIQDYPYMGATASVSCLYRCSFCNSVNFWGNYRKKDPRQTAAEMVEMYKKYGHQLFFMTDALLNPVVTGLAKEFLKTGITLYYDAYFKVDEASADINNTLLWRRGGLYRVRLGVESGSQKVLDIMDKRITTDMIKAAVSALAYAGIKTTTYWVIGHPGETEEDFQQSLELLEELQGDIFQAECNPFNYHFSGQSGSDSWKDKRIRLFPVKTDDMLVFKTWTLDCEPLREVAYKRMHRFVNHCKKLGIPNPYSLNEHVKADERWRKLHKNAVPSLLEFKKRGKHINEAKRVKKLHFLKSTRDESYDFGF